MHLISTLPTCRRTPCSTKPLPSRVGHMKQPFGLTNRHHPCIIKVNNTWSSKILLFPFVIDFNRELDKTFICCCCWSSSQNTYWFSVAPCHVSDISFLPFCLFCLYKLSPHLSCLTFFSFTLQVSLGRPCLLVLTVPHSKVFFSSSSSNSFTDV